MVVVAATLPHMDTRKKKMNTDNIRVARLHLFQLSNGERMPNVVYVYD